MFWTRGEYHLSPLLVNNADHGIMTHGEKRTDSKVIYRLIMSLKYIFVHSVVPKWKQLSLTFN